MKTARSDSGLRPRVTPAFTIQMLIVLGGVGVLLYSTALGVGLSPDSSAYIGAARGLRDGFGLTTPLPDGQRTPLVLYGPLFPLLLGAIGLLGIDPQNAAGWLNAGLFAANTLLIGHVVRRASGAASAAVVAAALFAISVPVVFVHSMAWSEPTFIFCSLVALLFIGRYLRHASRVSLVAAAVAIGCGGLARYAGLSLIGAAIAIVAWHRWREWSAMVRDAGIVAIVSGAFSGLWSVRNLLEAGTSTAHPAAFHPVTLAQLSAGLQTFASWWSIDVGPRRLPAALLAVSGFAAIVWYIGARRESSGSDISGNAGGAVWEPATIFVGAYLLFLLIAISFFDAPTTLSDRILSPAWVWAIVAGASGGREVIARRQALQPAVVAVAMWLAVAQLIQLEAWTLRVHREGEEYASTAWQHSDAIAWVKRAGPSAHIFSNGDDAIYLLAGRPAYRLPERFSPTTTEPNEGFQREVEAMRRRLRAQHGVVVYFSRIDFRPNIISLDELRTRLDARTTYVANDGVVLEMREP